jgi:NagD protein
MLGWVIFRLILSRDWDFYHIFVIGLRDGPRLQPDEIAMVGDRIYTDVAMAHNAGAFGVLVLSGETTLDTACAADPQPDLTALNIEEFGRLLLASKE